MSVFVSLLVGIVLGTIGTVVCAEIGEEDTVLILTDEVFQKALDENQLMLVKFYAPWCGNSKELAPEYANASKLLRFKDSEIKNWNLVLSRNSNVAVASGRSEFGMSRSRFCKVKIRKIKVKILGGEQAC